MHKTCIAVSVVFILTPTAAITLNVSASHKSTFISVSRMLQSLKTIHTRAKQSQTSPVQKRYIYNQSSGPN